MAVPNIWNKTTCGCSCCEQSACISQENQDIIFSLASKSETKSRRRLFVIT